MVLHRVLPVTLAPESRSARYVESLEREDQSRGKWIHKGRRCRPRNMARRDTGKIHGEEQDGFIAVITPEDSRAHDDSASYIAHTGDFVD